MSIPFYAAEYPELYPVRPWIAFVYWAALETRAGRVRRFATKAAAMRAALEFVNHINGFAAKRK